MHLIPETEPEKKGRVQHFLDCTEAEILDNYGDQIPTRILVGINSCEEQALRNLIPPCNNKFCSLRGEERRLVYCQLGALEFHISTVYINTLLWGLRRGSQTSSRARQLTQSVPVW